MKIKDNDEREERIALVADGCNLEQEEAEALVAKWEVEKAAAQKKAEKPSRD